MQNSVWCSGFDDDDDDDNVYDDDYYEDDDGVVIIIIIINVISFQLSRQSKQLISCNRFWNGKLH